MGYYSERIQGSNLQKFKVRFSVYGALASTALGFAMVLTPFGRKWWYRDIQEGILRTTPEQLERENRNRMMLFEGFSFESRDSREARKRVSFKDSNFKFIGNPGVHATNSTPEDQPEAQTQSGSQN